MPTPLDTTVDRTSARVESGGEAGEDQIRLVPTDQEVELLAEAPREYPSGQNGAPLNVAVLLTRGSELHVYDLEQEALKQSLKLPSDAIAMAHDVRRTATYVLVESGQLVSCRRNNGKYEMENEADAFGQLGSIERGFFVLPRSGTVMGVAGDGTVTAFDPQSGKVTKTQGPPPQPAGPAVDPQNDAWYYADREVFRYSLRQNQLQNPDSP